MASKRKILGIHGDPCPRCKRPTMICEHAHVTAKHKNQPYYYARWFQCINPDCVTTTIMPPRFIVWNRAGRAHGGVLRASGHGTAPEPENGTSGLVAGGRGPLPGEKPPWDE